MKGAWAVLVVSALLAGCAGSGSSGPARDDAPRASSAAPATGGGRYAMSGDAYPENPPDVSQIPDAVPRVEEPSRGGNRPVYEVWGKTYHVLPDARGYARQGTASWYGEKFHGYATSNGEIYDMYKMSAAHRSLPLPTYARVTSLDNGRSVIVRVNDRGPFHNDREIDLSYAAAARLDILERGTGRVKVEAIDPVVWLAENGGGGANQSATPAVQTAAQASSPAQASPRPVATANTNPNNSSSNSSSNSSNTIASTSGSGATDAGAASRGEGGDGLPIYLQIAALGSADNARALKARLERELSHPVRVADATGMYRVQVGPLAHAGQVEPVRAELRRAGFDQAFIVNGAD